MITKYNIDINNEVIIVSIDRLTNQIFKLLPSREEGGDWEIPLQNIILEFFGMKEILNQDKHSILFRLLCKLEALLSLTKEKDFLLFRATIFECLGLCNSLKGSLK